jgi:anti-sigma-K factor RskA
MSAEDQHSDPEECGGNAAPYVLGALTDLESEAFRCHIESCAICREEVAALRVVAAALPAAAPQLTASSHLKRRVMSAVQEDASRQPSQEAARARAPRRRAFEWLRWQPAVAGLAVAAVVIALAVAVFASGGAGNASTRVIRAEVLVPRASAQLRLGGGQAELTIANMPQSPPGRVYEVWLKGSGAPKPTDALFTVTSNGNASVEVPGVAHGIREVMVTSEPLGGSRAPTRPPVIIARLS